MSLRLFAIAVFVLTSQVAVAAPPKKLFDVTLEDVQNGGRVLNVVFYRKPPPPTVVDKILRGSLDHAILIDPTVDIVAGAFLGDDNLNSNQYSGNLAYKASQKKVITVDELLGTKTTTSATGSYFIEVRENEILAGPTRGGKFLSVMIVFSKQPSRDAAYDAIIAETRKLAARRLAVSMYVSVGDQKVKTSWHQMLEKDGSAVFAEYDATSKKLMRKGQLLKQLP